MNFHDLDKIFQENPSIRLMRARNAPMVLAFLFQAFKEEGKVAIERGHLQEGLQLFLEAHQPSIDEDEKTALSAEEQGPRARRYLEQWTDAQWLVCYVDGELETDCFQLTVHAEKALRWAESLETRSFVGAESQYQDLTHKMEALVCASSDDPEEQIENLQAQQMQLSERIARIRAHGRPEAMDDYQVYARVEELTRMGKELLADFKEVEENFKAIRRALYRQQGEHRMSRGRLLGHTLDALDALKQRDQGKSFYAFWHYLNSERHQRALAQMVREIIARVEERKLEVDTRFLRSLRHRLHEAGKSVVASNHLLAERLNRMIIGGNLQLHRQAMDTIRQIRELALQVNEDTPLPEPFLWLEGPPHIHLPLERKLGEAPQKPQFRQQPRRFKEEGSTKPGINALFSLYAIDHDRLREHISRLLEKQEEVSLEEVLKEHPLRLGLTEVLAYMTIASESGLHDIDPEWESILDLPNKERLVYLPSVKYRRH